MELEVQKHYEKLSDILTKLWGNIQGSQSHSQDKELRIVVYHELASAEQRERIKQKIKLY